MEQSVIVVGAGIIGAASAWHLAKAGHSVQIVDGGGANATSASFGWINASFFLNDAHHHLRAGGIAAWHRVTEELPVPVTWQGCLCWDVDPDEMDATYDQLRAHGYPVALLSEEEVAAREPALQAPPQKALFFPAEGAASSADLSQHFLAAAQSLGARVIRNVSVTGLATQAGRVVGVETSHGELTADQTVIAAGVGTAAIATGIGCEIPLVSRPAYILRTTPQPRMLTHILATPEGEIRQEPSGQFLIPAAVNHQADSATRLDVSASEAAEHAMVRLQTLCHGLEGLNWAEVTYAERPMPKDGLPIVGRIADGAHVAVLHSGITLGPIVAELVAKDVSGRLSNADAAMLAPYRPDRFQRA